MGAQIRVDDPLITLETEKASMDVPSPVSGTVASIEVKKGQEVSAGTLIATVRRLSAATAASARASAACRRASPRRPRPAARPLGARAAPTAAQPPRARSSWSCSAQVPAAIRRPFAPRIWA